MDFLTFLEKKDEIECSGMTGLYCIKQNYLPPQYQAVRAGLAGKPVDSATQYKSAEGTFLSRFSTYMNYFMPTSFTIFAVLTVPRVAYQGFAERVMPPVAEGDNREDYARLHLAKTLIQIREAQYHQLLLRFGAKRLGLPNTAEERKRGEFFKTDPSTCIRAMRTIGTGDLYIFKGDDVEQIEKITLKKRGIETIEPQQVPLRKNPQRKGRPGNEDDDLSDTFSISELDDDEDDLPLTVRADRQTVNQIINDPAAARAVAQLQQVRRKSPRLAGDEPIVVGMNTTQLDRLRNSSPRMQRAVQALQQVRRSPRLTARDTRGNT